ALARARGLRPRGAAGARRARAVEVPGLRLPARVHQRLRAAAARPRPGAGRLDPDAVPQVPPARLVAPPEQPRRPRRGLLQPATAAVPALRGRTRRGPPCAGARAVAVGLVLAVLRHQGL